MGIGFSLFLCVVGAVLTFAVDVNLHIAPRFDSTWPTLPFLSRYTWNHAGECGTGPGKAEWPAARGSSSSPLTRPVTPSGSTSGSSWPSSKQEGVGSSSWGFDSQWVCRSPIVVGTSLLRRRLGLDGRARSD